MPDPVFTLMVEPVKACNLACRYCYSDKAWERPMDMDLLRTAFARVSEYLDRTGVTQIHIIWHGGEPLLAGQDFFRESRALADAFFGRSPSNRTARHFVQTNGLLMDRDTGRFLRDHGYEVGISLDGPKEIHDRARVTHNNAPTWDRVMEKIELMDGLGLDFGICMTLTGRALGRESMIFDFFSGLGRPLRINPVIPSPGIEDRRFLLKPGAYGRFLCRIFDRWLLSEENRIRVSPLDNYLTAAVRGEAVECRHRPCCIGSHLGIRPDGSAVLCAPFESVTLGNILEHSLNGLYKSPSITAVLGRDKTIPGCGSCRHRHICHGGCPHFASAFGGALNSRDPFCRDYQIIFDHIREALDTLTAERI